jgi:hypothetical protein
MRSFLRNPLLALLGVFVAGAAASCIAPAATAQDATQPTAAEHAILTVQGRGVQIYTCQLHSGTFEWEFLAPAARLFDGDREVGTHGDGPVWHLDDGSSVYGQVIARSASPDATAIPWLLLKAITPAGETSRPGTLSTAEFIRRSDTRGGIAPTAGCDRTHTGDFARVPYTATYAFYSSK